MSFKKVVAVMGAATLMTGCATMFTDSTKISNVSTSTGKEIKIKVDGVYHNIPSTVVLSKNGQDKVIETDDPSCEKTTVVEKEVEGSAWLNLFWLPGGTITSFIVDSANSKMWTYEDNVVIVCS